MVGYFVRRTGWCIFVFLIVDNVWLGFKYFANFFSIIELPWFLLGDSHSLGM